MRKKTSVFKSNILDLGPMDFSLFGGLSEEDIKQQLASRDKFYDKFLLFDKTKNYTLEEYMKIRNVIGRDILFNDGIYQQFHYKFPNNYGTSVVRGSHTQGFWEVATTKFTDKVPNNPLPKKKRLRNKQLKKYGSTLSVISDPKRFKQFTDVEKYMAGLLVTHLLPV
ncbi:hypothetical protein O0Q50_22495 [Priestia aryabhattai]|uniref:Uncharacterized protein n=2 Tax=Priestia TaxID=2800373 RepID=A0AAX6NEN3_PRIAR|nr:hypothetical protein [Priestia aryabhattai]MDU9693954.1 hypothetical protein [Priestia aryabhattai]